MKNHPDYFSNSKKLIGSAEFTTDKAKCENLLKRIKECNLFTLAALVNEKNEFFSLLSKNSGVVHDALIIYDKMMAEVLYKKEQLK